jgi:hypothetical protein
LDDGPGFPLALATCSEGGPSSCPPREEARSTARTAQAHAPGVRGRARLCVRACCVMPNLCRTGAVAKSTCSVNCGTSSPPSSTHRCRCGVPHLRIWSFCYCSSRGNMVSVCTFGKMCQCLWCKDVERAERAGPMLGFLARRRGCVWIVGACWTTQCAAKRSINKFRIRAVRTSGWTRYI